MDDPDEASGLSSDESESDEEEMIPRWSSVIDGYLYIGGRRICRIGSVEDSDSDYLVHSAP